MKTRTEDTRLGTLAVERGMLSQSELDALMERSQTAERGRSWRSLLGELLVREHYVGASLLSELLLEQRLRRRQGPAPKGAALAASAPTLDAYLFRLRDRGARSLLLLGGRPPAYRIGDSLVAGAEPAIPPERIAALAADAFTAEQREAVARGAVVATTLTRPTGRFRATLGSSEQGLSITARPIGLDPQKDVELPGEIAALADLRRGLILVTGSRASLRSNVLAWLVASISERSPRHVIAIERHATYDHASKRALVTQREVGLHTESYEVALRAALREDPDVIVIGEMREPEAIATALLAAETGHLVIAGVHASTATQALRRVLDSQRSSRRALVRATLANALQAVAVVEAVRGKTGRLHVVCDLVPGTPGVAHVIREDRLHHLDTISKNQPGAVSRDRRLAELVAADEVSTIAALECAHDPRVVTDRKGAPRV